MSENRNPVAWFEIYVDDMSRAVNFYQSVLNIEFESIFDPSESGIDMKAFPANMSAHGSSGALVQVQGMPAGGNSTLVYFSCDDCAVEASRIEAAGGKLERDKMSIGEHGFCAHGFDSEGNMFGLHSEK